VKIGEADQARQASVSAARPHQRGLLVRFEGVESRDEAERLRGELVFIHQTQLSDLKEGWWESDLVGLAVVDRGGSQLGTIKGVSTSEHQDRWEIDTPNGPVYIPAVPDIVVEVDLEKRTVVLDPPAGLFE
jgi:16S rRNA processing protein RimM